MRKLYSALLLIILTTNNVWPEEHQPPLQRFVTYIQKKYLRKASKCVKRQYQNKHNRRVWLSIGMVGVAIFLSQRFELLKKTIWRKREKKKQNTPAAHPATPHHKQQPQRDTDSVQTIDQLLPPTPPPSRNTEHSSDSEENDDEEQGEFQQPLPVTVPASTEHPENQWGTFAKKSDTEVQQQHLEAQKTLLQAAKMAQKLRQPSIKHIAKDAPEEEQQQYATVVRYSDNEENEQQRTVVLHPETRHHTGAEAPKAAAAARHKAIPLSPLAAEGIERLIENHNVVRKLAKQARIKRRDATFGAEKNNQQRKHLAREEAKQEVIKRLEVDEQLPTSIARKVVDVAAQKLKQREAFRKALNSGDYAVALDLLPAGITHNGQQKLNMVITNIRQGKTVSKKDLRRLALIIWQLKNKDGAPISADNLHLLKERTHHDRAALLAIVGE